MKWLTNRKPVLTGNELNRLSNIFDNAGQVVLGAVVLSPLLSGFDKINTFIVLSGVVTTIICWLASLLFARRIEL